MLVSEVKKRIADARRCQSDRFPSQAELLDKEIKKLEQEVLLVMGQEISSFPDDKKVPKSILLAAEYLTSCHGL
jgi:hypothetical protein